MWITLIYIFAGISYTAAIWQIDVISNAIDDISKNFDLEEISREVNLTKRPSLVLVVVLLWPLFSFATLTLMVKNRT